MSKTHVIRNQLGQYATRKGEWISGREANSVAHFPHFDQALNQLFELGIKDIYLRGQVAEVHLNEAGKLMINEYGPEPEIPLPMVSPVVEGHAAEDVAEVQSAEVC